MFSFDLSGSIHKFKIKQFVKFEQFVHNSLLEISEQKAAIRNIHEPTLCKLLNENFSNTIRYIKAQISEVTNIAMPQQMLL